MARFVDRAAAERGYFARKLKNYIKTILFTPEGRFSSPWGCDASPAGIFVIHEEIKMRPPAIERMGYYPTDEPVIEIIRTYLKPSTERGRLFDPCAGEGRAASALGHALNCETWGVELSPDRAAKATQVMDKLFQAPWQACVLSDESVSWLYLNPPYEFDRFDNQKRLEWDFLKTTTAKLMRGGFLTYIVPQKILGIIEVARLLAGHYEALSVYRFPDGLFEKFKQVVIMATKRKVFQTPLEEDVRQLQALASGDLDALNPVPARLRASGSP